MKITKRQRRFLSVIFIITVIEFIAAVLKAVFADINYRAENITLALLCLVMIAVLFFPVILKKLWSVSVPNSMYVLFIIFCFCAIILGDVKDFYSRFAHWDDLLHFCSGMLLSVLGFMLVNTLNNSENMNISLNPFFVAAVAFCFTMTVQALWEIYEFLSDEFLGTNAQTFMQTTTGSFIGPDDVPLVGHEALRDTMTDFMLDGLGGLIISVLGYLELKKGKKGFSTDKMKISSEKNSVNSKSDGA